MILTLKGIEHDVASIAEAVAAGDNEKAHAIEDALLEDVLRYIAEGGENAQEFAAAALKSIDIEYERWMA